MKNQDCYDYFMVSREAMGLAKTTIRQYDFTLKRFLLWLDGKPITTNSVNNYIVYLQSYRKANGEPMHDTTIRSFVRYIKAFVRYLYAEEFLDKPVKVIMPKVAKRKLCVLDKKQIEEILSKDDCFRDVVLIWFVVASGVRNSELIQLNWGDINLRTGVIDVLKGKGSKYRITMIDKNTLKLVIKYHHSLKNADPNSPLFQKLNGERLTVHGVRDIIFKLSKLSGIKFTCHSLRRTFARLSVKNNMPLVFLQSLMGHSSIITTRDYVQELDVEDIVKNYEDHSPLAGKN